MSDGDRFSSRFHAPGLIPGVHRDSGSGAEVDPRHDGGGIKFLKVVGVLTLCAVLLTVALAAGQDRADLSKPLDLFAAAYFDLIQPWSIGDRVEYCGLFGRDGNGDLVAILAARSDADS